MSILDRIKNSFNFFEKDFSKENNKYLEIRRDSFFINDEFHKSFLEKGYCVVRDVVEQSEIDSFKDTFEEISNLEGYQQDNLFLNSGRLSNPEIRIKTQNIINKNAKTILPRMFQMDKVAEHTGGAFQIKPPHKDSALLLHQDSTVIDEETDYCLFVWIPFCDITLENGPISFLEGSHLWGNTQRSLGVPWQFLDKIDILNKYVAPVLLNAGDVLVFDPATMHSSAANLSKAIRHAITITVLRKDYQLIYYYRNGDIEDKLIEKYYVDDDFYYNYDFVSKPNEEKWKKEVVEFKNFAKSKRELLKLIKAHKAVH